MYAHNRIKMGSVIMQHSAALLAAHCGVSSHTFESEERSRHDLT